MNAKHQHFYQTSLRLIHNRGFKATTMREIAEALECDVSNLYNYVDSKQSILEKVVFELNEIFQDNIDQIIESELAPLDQLQALIRTYVELSVDRPLELSLLNHEWRNLKGEKLEHFILEKQTFERKVSSIIAKGIQDCSLIDMDNQLATHLFLSSLRLLFDHYANKEYKINKIELERQISQYVFQGMAALE